MRIKTFLAALLIFWAIILMALWLDASEDEERALALIKRSIDGWSLDIDKLRPLGIQSMRGAVYVRRWEYKNEQQFGILQVTAVTGLICFSKRDSDTGPYHNMECLQYPE